MKSFGVRIRVNDRQFLDSPLNQIVVGCVFCALVSVVGAYLGWW